MSPAYKAHVARSHRDREEAVREEQARIKSWCLHLRAERREAVRDAAAIAEGHLHAETLSRRQAQRLERYNSGELDQRLDEATIEHGFGTTSFGILEAPAFSRMV